MSSVQELIGTIRKRVNTLISDLQALKNENNKLQEKQSELLLTIENQNILIKELKDKNNRIIISETIKQTEGSKDVKKQIDEMVREIDRCIELLNK